MMNHTVHTPRSVARLVGGIVAVLLLLTACASSDSTGTAEATDPSASVADTSTSSVAEPTTTSDATSIDSTSTSTSTSQATTSTIEAQPAGADCDSVAELFVTRGSANADLDDPEVDATCDGDSLIITSNGIPDYTYIETSPGQPRARDLSFTIPATPTVAETTTAVPLIGEAAVTLGGIPIFGPTEGTGGDVESLPGILSDCGSHNGPSGFHIHLILTTPATDCLFTPEEVAAEPQLVGYAFDGFPIYTGIDQYTSSWELTDETLFATDTWNAHTYVAGSGDLDECNGRTDEDGNYAYYTTATFPYILGCYTGVVELSAPGGDEGDADRPERPEGDDAAEEDRPERPEGDEGGGERPEGDEGRPERPEPPADGDVDAQDTEGE